MKRIFSPAIQEVIEKRFPSEGAAAIAVDLGVHRSTVREWAKRIGVRQILGTRNPQYFDAWSNEMAYDLGYIYTDGNVSLKGRCLQLCCCSRDEEILVGLKSRLGSTSKLTRRVRVERSGTVTERSYTVIPCLHVARCLVEKHGILPGKSKLNIPFPTVPDCYLPHFLRGALDGDGTVSIATRDGGRSTLYLSWLGQHQFIRTLTEKLMDRLPLSGVKIHTKRHNLLYVKWAALSDLKLLHGFLYPSGIYPFLARKRDRLESYLKAKGCDLCP